MSSRFRRRLQSVALTLLHSRLFVEVGNRRYLAGVPLKTSLLELSTLLATTQRYLAEVRKPGEAKKAVSDADFVPKPKVVKRGHARRLTSLSINSCSEELASTLSPSRPERERGWEIHEFLQTSAFALTPHSLPSF